MSNNPVGVVYTAKLPEEAWFQSAYPEGGNIQGELKATANSDGVGVKFELKLSNLPVADAPLTYHLHVDPVPEDGNCTKTLAHLDPFERGEATPCDTDDLETCQVGDLSGKHGPITPQEDGTFTQTYEDKYASTLEGIGAFFGNRSVVFHFANKTRITCANFVLEDAGPDGTASTGLPVPTANGTSVFPTGATPTPSTSPAPPAESSHIPDGAGSSLTVGSAGAILFGAAVMFML